VGRGGWVESGEGARRRAQRRPAVTCLISAGLPHPRRAAACASAAARRAPHARARRPQGPAAGISRASESSSLAVGLGALTGGSEGSWISFSCGPKGGRGASIQPRALSITQGRAVGVVLRGRWEGRGPKAHSAVRASARSGGRCGDAPPRPAPLSSHLELLERLLRAVIVLLVVRGLRMEGEAPRIARRACACAHARPEVDRACCAAAAAHRLGLQPCPITCPPSAARRASAPPSKRRPFSQGSTRPR
jgi:hypothetical protein